MLMVRRSIGVVKSGLAKHGFTQTLVFMRSSILEIIIMARLQLKVVYANMKEKTVTSQTPSRSILTEELGNLNECALADVTRLAHSSRNMRRWRGDQANHPPIPQTINGFQIPREFGVIENGSIFLQNDSGIDDVKRILIFATNDALHDLRQCANWAGVRTFKSCPVIFFQLYVLHIQIKNFSAPRLFALLPDKSQNTYNRLFQKVKESVNNEGPDAMKMDFEKAAQNAFSNTFPETTISFCLFHLGQNVYRHIVVEGFKVRYHEDDIFSIKLRSFIALAFLPINEVADAFDELVDDDDDDDIPQPIVSYFENSYTV